MLLDACDWKWNFRVNHWAWEVTCECDDNKQLLLPCVSDFVKDIKLDDNDWFDLYLPEPVWRIE